MTIRPGEARDLPAIIAIDNHYIRESAITFHTEAFGPGGKDDWFSNFAASGRHQLFVSEEQGCVTGYACTTRFRTKAAYDTSVETTIYLAPDATGRGLGRALYGALLGALEGEGIHRLIAGITLPNPASQALHAHFGFEDAGTMHEIGYKLGRYWDVLWMQRRFE